MLQMHNLMKADEEYQIKVEQQEIRFQPEAPDSSDR